jgi:hypothetical protein
MSTILMLAQPPERYPATGGAFRQRIGARNVSTLNAANTNHDDYCRDFLEGMASNRQSRLRFRTAQTLGYSVCITLPASGWPGG